MSKSKSRARRRSLKHSAVRRLPPGTAPGTLVVDPLSSKTRIRVMSYGPDQFTEMSVLCANDLKPLVGAAPVLWVDVDGLGDLDAIKAIGELFAFHPLSLEDVLNVHQRPKLEQYDHYLFLVARMVTRSEHVETEQLSIFLGKGFVVTFQENTPGDSLEPVRDRIRGSVGRIRAAGPDYLAYALLDAVIDNCFPILEQYGEELETLEDQIIFDPDPHTVPRIHGIKRDLLTLRRTIWPMRDELNALVRDPCPLIADETRVYLRDCYDHTVRIIDLVETQRELGSDLRDLYLTSINNRMNEVMKVLTIISTIFMPMTFISGVYGMNFNPDASEMNMPELNWKFGYPFALLLMVSVAGLLSWFFLRKGWIGRVSTGPSKPPDPHREPVGK